MTFLSSFANDIFKQKYAFTPDETWDQCCERVVEAVCADLLPYSTKYRIKQLMKTRQFIPGGRYLYSAGRPFHNVNNCFLYRAEDSREGWSDLMHKSTMSLMTGGGIGVDYSDVRPENAPISKTGGKATGPLALMRMVNEAGRHIMQGGQRRSAIWAGLNWNHPDIHKFILMKNHPQELKKLKENDFTFPLDMELTNISVIYDTAFFNLVDTKGFAADIAWQVFADNCFQAFSTAEPGFAFNYLKDRESLRNACTEVTSEDDSDKCNLGTLFISKFDNIEAFKQASKDAVAFLLCGSIYSDVPTDKIREVGARNNRIGLGLGGMHEWLMQREQKYEVTDELHAWLNEYKNASIYAAEYWCEELKVQFPKGLRSLAPNGTIGILAETTTSGEPMFCGAYKRRYFKDGTWHHQYVIDGTVKRLMARGVKPESIVDDAYSIGFEQRVKFQADVQDYVDMAISSTCNMAEWGTVDNNYSNVKDKAQILYKYAKRLRGFTVYPDACRGGQPLTRVSLAEALEKEGKMFLEETRDCVNGVCGL